MFDGSTDKQTPAVGEPPDPQPRPKLAAWLWSRGLSNQAAAPWFSVSWQTVRRWCLPFGHAERRMPGEEELRRIIHVTGGEVTAEDFYLPELTARGADAGDGAEAQP